MLSVQSLFDKAFSRPRDPRSAAYKTGVKAALASRIDHVRVVCPFGVGTAESDAFFAGTEEGHRIWREAVAEKAEA